MRKSASRRVVFITGASDGLGLALSRLLVECKDVNGAPSYIVVMLSRNQKKLQPLAEELACPWGTCDIGDWESVQTEVERLVKKVGCVDALVHCAGVYATGDLESLDPQVIEEVFKVNTLGPIYVTKALFPHIRDQKEKQVILVNSIVGINRTERPRYWLYPLSKVWAMDWGKVMANELASYGINISIVYPGAMDTNFSKKGSGITKDTSSALQPSVVAEKILGILENPNVRINDLTITGLQDFYNIPKQN